MFVSDQSQRTISLAWWWPLTLGRVKVRKCARHPTLLARNTTARRTSCRLMCWTWASKQKNSTMTYNQHTKKTWSRLPYNMCSQENKPRGRQSHCIIKCKSHEQRGQFQIAAQHGEAPPRRPRAAIQKRPRGPIHV